MGGWTGINSQQSSVLWGVGTMIESAVLSAVWVGTGVNSQQSTVLCGVGTGINSQLSSVL